jgi:tRNA A-37 threonylcarbamoyl transferase component Bud32
VIELSASNACEWLSAHGFPSACLRFAELGGGISNKLVLAEGPEFRVVLKQSLGQLRTAREWNSDRGRIFREAAAMRWAEDVDGLRVPRLLCEDAADFTIAMEAAPAGAEMWKTQLFRGEFQPEIARAAGVALGSMIRASWHSTEAQRLFGDQTVFDELRIDPYYRYTAAQCPEATGYIGRLIKRSSERRVSLAHGDWSPKNLLVNGSEVWVIDWEVIHYGDPSFDVAFLLNHLLMKSIAMPQHRVALKGLACAFVDGLSTEWAVEAALEHLPALLLARVEGKSPAEYLDAAMQLRARALALDLMQQAAESPEEAFER